MAHALLPVAGKGKSDWSYAPIPVVGPLLGGALAGWLLRLLAVSTVVRRCSYSPGVKLASLQCFEVEEKKARAVFQRGLCDDDIGVKALRRDTAAG